MRIRLAELADAEAIRDHLQRRGARAAPTPSTWCPAPGPSRRPGSSSTAASTRPWWPTEPPDSGHRGPVGANGEIVLGFGSLSSFRERSGYSATAENSVYVDRAQRGTGRRAGAARRAPRPGLGPRLPLGHRPDRRAQRDLHRRCTRPRASSWSGSSARSGASTASGSTWSSSSACSERTAPGGGRSGAPGSGLEHGALAVCAGSAGRRDRSIRHDVVQLPSGTMATAHSTMTASTMLAGSVCTSSFSRSAPPGQPDERRHGREPEHGVEPSGRSRPGATMMIPQVRYQGWTTGPSSTKVIMVMPRAPSTPMRSRWRRQ